MGKKPAAPPKPASPPKAKVTQLTAPDAKAYAAPRVEKGPGHIDAATVPKGTPLRSALNSWTKRLATYRKMGVSNNELVEKIVPVMRYDMKRVKKGSRGMANDEALALAVEQLGRHSKAAKAMKALTEEPDPDFLSDPFGTVTNEISSFIEVIPKLPQLMVDEAGVGLAFAQRVAEDTVGVKPGSFDDVTGIARMGVLNFLSTRTQKDYKKEVADILREGDKKFARGDIGGGIKVAATKGPIARDLPGSYTIGTVAAGDWEDFNKHPLLHTLDAVALAAPSIKVLGQSGAFGEASRAGSAAEALSHGNVYKGLFRAAGGEVPAVDLAKLSERSQIAATRALAAGEDLPAFPRTSELGRRAAESVGVDKVTREELLRPMRVAQREMHATVNKNFERMKQGIGELNPEEMNALGRHLAGVSDEPLSPRVAEAASFVREEVRNVTDKLAARGDLMPLEIQGRVVGHYSTAEPLGKALAREQQLESRVAGMRNGDIPYSEGKMNRTINDLKKVRQDIYNKAFGFTKSGRPTLAQAPREFRYMTQERAMNLMMDDLRGKLTRGKVTPEQFQGVLDNLAGPEMPRAIADVFGSQKGKSYWQRFVRQASREWTDWSLELGYDPVYLPHASESMILSMMRGPIPDRAGTAGVLKAANVYNVDPGVANIAMLLTYRDAELFRADFARQMVNHTAETWGLTEEQVTKLESANATTRTGLRRAIRANWVSFNDTVGQRVPQVHVSGSFPSETKLMIPRRIANEVDKALSQFSRTKLGTFDKATNTFRLAVTSTPRHLVHVTVSGMMFALGEQGFKPFMHLPQAWDMVKKGAMPGYELGTDFFGGLTSDEMMIHLDGFVKGRTLSDNLPVISQIKSGAEWMKHFEERVANTWKVSSFLTDYDKSLGQGMTHELATQGAIKEALRIHFDSDSMSLLERGMTRFFMPFYPFTRQILRYVLRYPADHPIRAAFVANLSHNESELTASGLPTMFESYLYLGEPDKDGNVTTIDTKTINPFRSFGESQSPLSFGGFTAGMNPLFRTALEVIGVDTLSGRIKQYPGKTVDPHYGTVQSSYFGDLFSSTLKAYIPQSDLLLQWANFKDAVHSFTEDDKRHRLFSLIGIPFMPFSTNARDARIRLQMAYYTAAKSNIQEAIYNGDYGGLHYPYVPYRGKYLTPQQIEKQRNSYHRAFPSVATGAVVPTTGTEEYQP